MPSKIRKICVELPKTLFNPELIMNSGQVFRMLKKQGMYHVYSGDKAIAFKRRANQYEFYTTIEDWNEFWVNYFDFNTDYSKFNEAIRNSKDEFLENSMKMCQGMRILRQDLWETIVTFIISQQNNIPKISKTVEILCERFGSKRSYYTGLNTKDIQYFYTFPSADRIANLSLKTLSDGTMLGYRAEYILELAKAVKSNKFSLEELQNLTYEEAMKKLQSVKGIGPKVGNCICLYGLHLLESYPIDTWMKKIIEDDYSQYSLEEYKLYIDSNYKGFQGYVQQIQFYYKRNL